MQSSEDRFRSEDPFKGQGYDRPDFSDMLDRITAAPLPRARRGFLSFRARLVTAGVAVTMLTVTAASVTEFASTPVGVAAGPALHLSSTVQASAADTNSPVPLLATELRPLPSGSYAFSAAGTLGGLGASGLAYAVTVPTSPNGAVARINQSYGILARSVTFSSSDDLLPMFSFDADALGSDVHGGGLTVRDRYSESSLRATARGILTTAGFNYGLGLPRVTSAGSQVRATFPVTLGGLATSYSMVLSVDGLGQVVQVSGPAFRVSPPVSYPLRSTTSGLAEVGSVQPGWRAAGFGLDNAASPVFHATVRSASLSLGAYQTAAGRVWLLPTYTYDATFRYRGHTVAVPAQLVTVLAVSPSRLSPVTRAP